MSRLIVVVGATGQQGNSVVDFLLKEPHNFTVRGLTRNPGSPAAKDLAAKGVEVVKAELDNLDEVTSAFTGAWGVFGLTQFYEHGYKKEQLHGRNIVDAAKTAGVMYIVFSTVEGREGECKAISWTSKAEIEDRVIESGIPYTFVYIPMYYENFWTSFFAPSYDEEKGFTWTIAFMPDIPIFAFSVSDLGAWVVPAFREPKEWTGKAIKLVTEFLSIRDIATQFSEVTGEKAGIALEMAYEQFEASRYANHPAAESMYFSWEYVIRAGPNSGVRSQEQTLSIYRDAKKYREWVKDSPLVKNVVAKLKGEAAAKKSA